MTLTSGAMDKSFRPRLEPFSSQYEVFWNAEVVAWPDDEAVMEKETYQYFDNRQGGEVVAKIGGLTYYLKPESAMPAGYVAVPERNHDNPKAVLMQK